MQDPEVHGDRIKGSVGERQVEGVAHDEAQARTAPACPVDHRLGNIEADRGRASPGRRLGHVTRTARDVEESQPGAYGDRVEQRADEEDRVCPTLLVTRGGAFPARALELPE
jgi:hypothetical protein